MDSSSSADTFGMGLLNVHLVREKRLALGLSQEEAARLAGVRGGRARWSDIESGRRDNVTMETLAGLARALKCEPSELLQPAK